MFDSPEITSDKIPDLITKLKNNEALAILTLNGELIVRHEGQSDLETLNRDVKKLHLVSLETRPGAPLFSAILENSYYQPETYRNSLFELRYLSWEDLIWMVISIPLGEWQNAFKASLVSQMRLADGFPLLLSGEDEKKFPLHHRNTWTLENLPNSPIYNGPLEAALERARTLDLSKEEVARYKSSMGMN